MFGYSRRLGCVTLHLRISQKPPTISAPFFLFFSPQVFSSAAEFLGTSNFFSLTSELQSRLLCTQSILSPLTLHSFFIAPHKMSDTVNLVIGVIVSLCTLSLPACTTSPEYRHSVIFGTPIFFPCH